MVLILWITLMLQTPNVSLQQGLDYLKNNNWPMAEAEFLATTATYENLHDLARGLTQTTLLSGNPPSKQAFWQEYLEKQGPERALGLAILAGLALEDSRWDDFQKHAQPLLTEIPTEHPLLRYKLLYHLARHTTWQPTDTLTASESDWFKAARQLAPEERLPNGESTPLPFLFRHAYLLEQKIPFQIPEGVKGTPEQRFMLQLLRAQLHVIKDEANEAAQLFNQFGKIKLSDFDPNLRAIFYPVQRDFYLSRDLPKYANQVQATLDKMKPYAPFLMLPDQDRVIEAAAQRTAIRKALEAAEQERREAEANAKAEAEKRAIAAETERREAEANAKAEAEKRAIAAETERREAEAKAKAEAEKRAIAAETKRREAEAKAKAEAEKRAQTAEQKATNETPGKTPELPETTVNTSGSLQKGLDFLKDNNWPMAEGELLNTKPTFQNLHDLARGLAQTTLLSGNPQSKQSFWKAYLQKNGPERALGLAILAGLAIKDRRWDGLLEYAQPFLAEVPADQHLLRYKLLYHLARHTTWQPTTSLTDQEMEWFKKARLLAPQQQLPNGANTPLPFTFRHAYLLEQSTPYQIPEAVKGTPSQRFMLELLRAQLHVIRDEANEAAQMFNQLGTVKISDFDPDLRAIFYPVQRDFYLSRDLPNYAEQVQTSLNQMALFTPFLMVPDERRAQELYQNRISALKVQEAADQRQHEAEKRTQAAENVDGTRQAFLDIEAEVMSNPIAMELKVRALEPITTYEKAKKNYLLGWIYLRKGRLDAAMERLELARQLIQGYPFYKLQLKIYYAFHQYYEQAGDDSRALWYAVSANQIFHEPTHLGFFANYASYEVPDITGSLIDNWLVSKDRDKGLGQVLYLSEKKKHRNRLAFALKRNALADDAAINNSLAKTGQQMQAMIETLAHDPNASITPSDYNRMVDQWVEDWAKIQPFYANQSFADLPEVQARLLKGDRLFLFVEGDTSLGLIIISNQQSFLLDLGSRSRFLAMPKDQRIDLLVRRTGALLQGQGKVFVIHSPSFFKDSVLQGFVNQAQPKQAPLWFPSIKAWFAASRLPNCSGRMVLYETPYTDAAKNSEDESLVRMAYDANLPIERILQNTHNLAWLGNTAIDADRGLLFSDGQATFTLQQLINIQPNFCTLMIQTNGKVDLADLLAELRLLNPQLATSVFIIDEPGEALQTAPWEDRIPGVRLP